MYKNDINYLGRLWSKNYNKSKKVKDMFGADEYVNDPGSEYNLPYIW